MRIENRTRGTILATRASVARRASARATGLLRHDSLHDGEALVLMPCTGLHTFGMRFPLDVLLLQRQLRVLGALENIRPGRIATLRFCFAAVELPVGLIRASGTGIGDTLWFGPPESPAES